MQFSALKLRDNFRSDKYPGMVMIKVSHSKPTCCTPEYNALSNDGKYCLLSRDDEVIIETENKVKIFDKENR